MPSYISDGNDWWNVKPSEKQDVDTGKVTKASICTGARSKKKD